MAEMCRRFLEKVGKVGVLEGAGDWLIGTAQVDDDRGRGTLVQKKSRFQISRD